MVTLIAVERMVAVYFPFSASSVITPARTQFSIILIYLSVGIIYIPRSFLLYIKWEFSRVTNITEALLYQTDFYISSGFVIYDQVVISSLATVVPTLQ